MRSGFGGKRPKIPISSGTSFRRPQTRTKGLGGSSRITLRPLPKSLGGFGSSPARYSRPMSRSDISEGHQGEKFPSHCRMACSRLSYTTWATGRSPRWHCCLLSVMSDARMVSHVRQRPGSIAAEPEAGHIFDHRSWFKSVTEIEEPTGSRFFPGAAVGGHSICSNWQPAGFDGKLWGCNHLGDVASGLIELTN